MYSKAIFSNYVSKLSTKSKEQVGPSENADDVLADGTMGSLFDETSSKYGSTSSGASYPYYGPQAANSSTSTYGDVIGKSETGTVNCILMVLNFGLKNYSYSSIAIVLYPDCIYYIIYLQYMTTCRQSIVA